MLRIIACDRATGSFGTCVLLTFVMVTKGAAAGAAARENVVNYVEFVSVFRKSFSLSFRQAIALLASAGSDAYAPWNDSRVRIKL